MKKAILRKYAKLAAKVGANVQKGQDVVVYASVDQEELTTYVVEECYKLGARRVMVEWNSDKVTKVALRKEGLETLSEVAPWVIDKQKYYNKELPAMIHILSDDPDGLKGVSQSKLMKIQMKRIPILKPLRDERENKYQWTIIGAPSFAWAKKVFPNLSKRQAMEKLWEAILFTSRVTDDPIQAWNEHNADLEKRTNFLNSLDIDFLHYQSSNGTDFKVWLSNSIKWEAGGEKTLGSNIFFNPNIPTEECFTTPIKGKAEGKVVSTKPLSYQSQLIENFSITFKGGKAVEVHAEKNQKLLEQMISIDEGAAYLGECALVPYDSPINNLGILFYNTLYDENCCCHLALGMGFTNLVKDFDKYTNDQLHDMGVNDSAIHVDFMIGSKDLNIVAHLKDGSEVQLFKDGNWAF